MKIIALTLAAILSTSTAHAGAIVWRAPTAGVLAASTPATGPQTGFSLSYGSIKVRAGTNLALTPVIDGKAPQGVAFAGNGLPAGTSLDAITGRLTGRITAPGAYSFTITAIKDGQTATAVVSITVS